VTAEPITTAKPTHRSAVTNGSEVLPGVDGRSTWVRRLRDLIESHIDDLGGLARVTEAERSLVRRIATLTVELERMEARFATNGQATAAELDLYARGAGHLRRMLETIGTKRRPRNVTPGVDAYLADSRS